MLEPMHLRTTADLDTLLRSSHKAPVLIFKHSLTCGISSSALRRFQKFLDELPADDPTITALIEIQRAREVSNAVAARTGVRHQSPQVLLIRDGEVVWHASHGSIQATAIDQALAG